MDRGYQFHAGHRGNEDYSRVFAENLSEASLGLRGSSAKKKECRKEEEKVRLVKTVFWMLVFLLFLLFCIQNQDPVTLQLVFLPMENYQWFEIPRVPLPLFLVILCFIFLGILIGGAGDLYRRFQLKKALRQNQKTIERLEREVQSLRDPGLNQPSFLKKGD